MNGRYFAAQDFPTKNLLQCLLPSSRCGFGLKLFFSLDIRHVFLSFFILKIFRKMGPDPVAFETCIPPHPSRRLLHNLLLPVLLDGTTDVLRRGPSYINSPHSTQTTRFLEKMTLFHIFLHFKSKSPLASSPPPGQMANWTSENHDTI